jgi:hypothetical protein
MLHSRMLHSRHSVAPCTLAVVRLPPASLAREVTRNYLINTGTSRPADSEQLRRHHGGRPLGAGLRGVPNALGAPALQVAFGCVAVLASRLLSSLVW